ncbi:hypothetical protein KFE25_008626 [Diacronema lutheri]|uniref:Uncharacterized protein n=1 Tax=Diacronema lutheri TaxID=2081491 RepID=A0A8J5XYE5_DIALT|nr:hypothetical protein KFE25_008626 [Diacronema lutheri]
MFVASALAVASTLVYLAGLPTPRDALQPVLSRPARASARTRELVAARAASVNDLEKVQEMCGNCYKMNRCSELALGNYSDAKQECLCAGVGPWAEKPCSVQCAKTGPHPVVETKLMPCQKTACNHCSRNCGGGNYWSNPGTIANWQYSSTFTSGKTWTRGYCQCMRTNCFKECEDVSLFSLVADCSALPEVQL